MSTHLDPARSGPLLSDRTIAGHASIATAQGDAFRQALQQSVGDQADLRFDEPMHRHTTLRIGGPADIWVAPRSVDCLQRVVGLCHQHGVPLCVLGSGSNLLVRDGGVRGVVLCSEGLRGLRFDPGPVELPGSMTVYVEAGVSTGKLLSEATRRGLGGIEFLGGVPGSVGGGLVMNAGTYLGEFKDVTTQVDSVRPDGQLISRSSPECGFVYRGSALPRDEVVVSGRLLLRPRPRDQIEADVRCLRDRRHAREPHGFPNAGSFFKNPPGDFAGRLIEACGLKGTRIGSAEVAQAHANWILNVASRAEADVEGDRGSADSASSSAADASAAPAASSTAASSSAATTSPAVGDRTPRKAGRSQTPGSARDTLALIELVRSAVLSRFGIALDLEVRVIGDDLA